MKKAMMFSGTFSASAFIIGSLFKLMQLYGAVVLLFSAITIFSFVFIPLIVLLKNKETNNLRDKLTLVLGALAGILFCLATLFSVQHWKGSSDFWLATIVFCTFVFVPYYFFTGLNKQETRVNTIVTSIIIVGAMGLLFTLLQVRKPLPTQMYTYIKNEQLLKHMQHALRATTVNYATNNKLANDINNTSDEIKELILQQEIGMSSIPADFEQKKIVITERNIGLRFYTDRVSELFEELRSEVNRYNALTDWEENKIPTDHSILDVTADKLDSYNNLAILNNITQIQLYLVNAQWQQSVGETKRLNILVAN